MANTKKPPVERTVVPAKKARAKATGSHGEQVVEKTPRQRATGMRLLAVLFWLIAIACEVFVIALFNGTLYIPEILNYEMAFLIGGIVLILIFVIIGSQLWKKANRIDPVSKKTSSNFTSGTRWA